MSARRKNKVLATDIVKQCFKLEMLTYSLIDKWKKQYKYTLIESFRKHVENLREAVICALRCRKQDKERKLYFYDLAMCSMDNIEYLLELMVSGSFNIISNKQYADFAIIIDDIGIMIDRLTRFLCKEPETVEKTAQGIHGNGSDFQSCDDERDLII